MEGVSAFTFKGKVNTNTNWLAVTQGITITATYTFATSDTAPDVVTGTNAMVTLTPPASRRSCSSI